MEKVLLQLRRCKQACCGHENLSLRFSLIDPQTVRCALKSVTMFALRLCFPMATPSHCLSGRDAKEVHTCKMPGLLCRVTLAQELPIGLVGTLLELCWSLISNFLTSSLVFSSLSQGAGLHQSLMAPPPVSSPFPSLANESFAYLLPSWHLLLGGPRQMAYGCLRQDGKYANLVH